MDLMRVISAAELSVLANELQEFCGFYIDRFYEVSDGKFRFKLSKNKVQLNLQIILSHTINKTNYIERQDQATSFTMAMRKRIEGFLIKGIRQVNNDRIMLFELGKGEVILNLIAEMFGKGNLIVTDSTMKILLAYRQQEFKERVIRPNMEYKTPKQNEGYKIAIPDNIIPNGFRSLQEALDSYYYENPVNEQKDENSAQKRAIEELNSSIRKQERILEGIDKEINENKEAGQELFSSMAPVNELIKAAQANKRITKEELQKMFPKIKVLNVDLKSKILKIEIE